MHAVLGSDHSRIYHVFALRNPWVAYAVGEGTKPVLLLLALWPVVACSNM